ncbi:hypothetical protein [Mycolicibacter virginiensis]|uniref:hypothetical protein n=1 Tax=Mycolicibacter virginiensis TaxID=1795032 RepID=UPI001F03A03B|nr:hypothetical protein [Mycolicibacter virginiensis]ULP48065.1 hypothetical protein MJO54_02515 [Mycolicibacter virginiensis]
MTAAVVVLMLITGAHQLGWDGRGKVEEELAALEARQVSQVAWPLPDYINAEKADQAASEGVPFVWMHRDRDVPCHPMVRMPNGQSYYVPAQRWWGTEGDGRMLDTTMEYYGCSNTPDRTIPGTWLTCAEWSPLPKGAGIQTACVFRAGYERKWSTSEEGGQAQTPWWPTSRNAPARESWTCRGGLGPVPGYIHCDW